MRLGGRDAAGGRARRRAQARTLALRHKRSALAALVLIVTPLVVLLAEGGSDSHGRARSNAPATTPRPPAATSGSSASGAGRHPSGGVRDRESAQVRALIALGKPIYCGATRGN